MTPEPGTMNMPRPKRHLAAVVADLNTVEPELGFELAETYRRHYVDDPAGQFQGYQDTDPERAWGLAEWALRAGQGALFDWITANALLPEADPQPANPDRIDRHTVRDLGEIAAAYDTIQLQVDKADAGLNPLGLAKNVVPFDIDPTRIAAGETHFEQVYERALKAMDNAVAVFDHANSLSQSLRALQDSETDFARNTQARERDYKNRLIGRSVWNTDWMLIIPGGTFLYDPDQGLETFINTVSDVKIFFQTYAYSGN